MSDPALRNALYTLLLASSSTKPQGMSQECKGNDDDGRVHLAIDPCRINAVGEPASSARRGRQQRNKLDIKIDEHLGL